MKNSRALFNIVAHDAMYFMGTLFLLFGGLFGLHALGLNLFMLVLYATAIMPVLFSIGVHFGKDLEEVSESFRA